MGRACSQNGGRSTGKRPLGRPRRRWEENIRMDLEEIGINWVDLAQRSEERRVGKECRSRWSPYH